MGWKIGAWSIIVLMVLVFGSAIFGEKDPDKYSAGGRANAEFMAEAGVKALLAAPSTASFSGRASSLKGGIWTVTGSVDAQNAFGAMLRKSYACAFRFDGDKWFNPKPCEIF